MKKLTIVTVTYNAKNVLEDTIKSVLSQNQFLIEYIIIDGGSQDGTIEIIKKYEDKISFWKSEKDNGIYDAMNKSLFYATSEWICFMNAGDEFYNNEVVNEIFSNDNFSTFDIIYGNHAYIKNGIQIVKTPLNLRHIWKRMPICHQSIFTKTNVLKKYPFNLKYKYASDYDFILNYYKKSPQNFLYINIPISIISLFGLSESNSLVTYFEYMNISYTAYKNIFIKYYFYIIIIKRILINSFKKIVI